MSKQINQSKICKIKFLKKPQMQSISTCISIQSLLNTLSKMFSEELSMFLGYYYLNVGGYFDSHSASQEVKWLRN